MTSEPRESVLNLLTPNILLVGHKFDKSQASHLIPRLAISLVMGMPEYFPGEHLQTAQIITTGTTKLMMPECLKLIFYQISNNMVETWEADDFKNIYTLISETGLLSAIDSLRRARQQDLAIRAFMDNLFRDLMRFIFLDGRIESPKILVKWLLSLGQDPNISFGYSTETALECAILSRQLDIVEPLLKAGATLHRRSNLRSIMSFLLPDRICDNETAQIIRLLSGHYKSLTAEETLHAAILLQDDRLFEQALDIGADASLPIQVTGKSPFLHPIVVKTETALSTAAAVSIYATRRVFDLLQNQSRAIEAKSFITPDVFISAACVGNADVIRFLHEINPIGFRRNARGVTPLEVAIQQGHQEAFQLLFQLYRQSSASLLLIPILADQLDILQYLLANGLDVNLTMKAADIDACGFLVPDRVPHRNCPLYNKHKSPTVLELLLRHTPVRDDWNDGIRLLIRSGAIFSAIAILEMSSAGHDDILPAALDTLSDPNIHHFCVNNALVLALQSKSTKCVQFLLERCAELQTSTSDVFEALVPEHVFNIQGERGRDDPRLRAILLEHWVNIFDSSKDSLLIIDAAIIAQDDARLKCVLSELQTYYSPSSLCSAVLVENDWAIDFLLKNRPLQAPHDILEGTAVGLAAMLGNLPMARKLVAKLQKPETALLPFDGTRSPFVFSHDKGLDITSSHIFWHKYSSDLDDFDHFDDLFRPPTLSKGSPLALAASCRGTSGVLELLSYGYQPDDITWARAFSMDTLDCLRALMNYNVRVRSLQLPLSTLSPLLEYAIHHKMEETVVWLIELGADINENDPFQDLGRSPVQLAIELGHLTIAESLLRSGAEVNAAPSIFDGVTALQCAAIGGHIGLAKQLLDAGARVNARGSRQDGRTALEGAAEGGRLDMVELLLHHGALITGPGRFQFIGAIHLAEGQGHHATAALLRQSREWTDEDTHVYDSMCPRCEFSGSRLSSKRCHAYNSAFTQRRYCCDEIHMPEDDCYHCYTEDEERLYDLKLQEEKRELELETELDEDVELEEGLKLADVGPLGTS
ncbi:hypothetical protein F25303_6426 [Fusarium sp. NRRL 25303]|nr:hypothetical protein F25303_6426 [Fusarium sp. NRRL 25303]